MPTDQDKTIRKLRAILSADVKGYSLLMANDEAFTIKTLKAYRNIMSDLIKQHSGRVVDSPGDNVLAEFSSVVDAVTCATEVQKVLKVKNEDLPDEKRLEFRIGVNIGDVVQDGNRIYGNGVNVAARIEGLAEPGGVSISRNAYGQIKDKLTFGYEYIGEHEVKNIKDPIRVYKVLMGPADSGKLIGEEPRRPRKKWFLPVAVVAAIIVTSIVWYFYQTAMKPDVEPASIKKMALQLPDKPSIAVLPFTNMSNDPEQEYFSDGMTDDIITDLSKISGLMVISSSSTFTYKGKEIKIPVVAKELGVKYVLEGSVRRVGDEVRINAQLIDAVTDHHLWADRFDGKNESIFALQDKITKRIVSALAVKLSTSEQKVTTEKGTNNIAAYDNYLKGMSHLRKFTPKDYVKAIEYFEKAIALDPNYSEAYANLAYIYISALQGGQIFWDEIGKSYTHCQVLAKHHLESAMKNPTSRAYQVKSYMELKKRNFDEVVEYAELSVTISPNDSDAWEALGRALVMTGNPEAGIKKYKKAIMLDPLHKSTGGIGYAYFTMGDYEQAVRYIEKALKDYPKTYGVRGFLAASYAFLGNDVKAKKTFEEFFT
ncbi:MAG: tetratricopeptide repeat protein [Nitrospinales bacterium]